MTLLGCALGLLACDPEAKNLGVESARDGGWAIDWRVDGAMGGLFEDAAAMPDGSVVVVESNGHEDHTTLRRFATDGTASVLLDEHYSAGSHLAVTESAILFATPRYVSGTSGLRATVRRLSYDGEVQLDYTHPRTGDANSFPRGIAVADTEVALVIGNWGALAEDEPWFEVQRLDHDLVPIAEAIPFEHDVVDVAYDASGSLVILEAPYGAPARLHRPLSDLDPVSVDCASLLVEGGAPLCITTYPPVTVTNYENGEVEPIEALDLASYVRSSGLSSTVLAGASDPEGGPLRVVEVLDDGEIGRSADIALAPMALGAGVARVTPTADGAVYALAYEAFQGPACGPDGPSCPRGFLVRLAAP